MEQESNEWLSQLETDGIISDLDPWAVEQLAESLSRDLTANNPEPYIPASDMFAVRSVSSLNFAQDDPTPSHGLITWGVKEEEGIDPMVLERSNAKASSSRLPNYAQEHVLAERKRREKLAQQFHALSMLVPELKKTNQVSLLDSAIHHLKSLQKKVEDLEEGAKRREQTDQIVQGFTVGNDRNNPEGFQVNSESLPKVVASLQGNTISLRIQCEKRKGALVKMLSEIEKLCLSVINTNVMQFGSSLIITITTEIEEGFSMTLADVTSHLTSMIRRFH